ncbi:DUF6266 family protein [Aequorivita xiaoshiensis]|jgi:hypothetical protein|uniref:DUF6266 family protein n=1 Tax=Aequorivita xiaoshiensis TaxID=2874476 RepID=A0A9X1R2R1_9FLAO|nr:DUF6266 family protein [Aequorivita xiaoshiensis]MCG2431650.1 DUF6266 family protein [Aequorivita xiaoshiensis]
MAIINQGILGGVSGKIGNVIGGTWKGIDYLRIKPSSVANPKTEGQLDQRSKFAKVLHFLQPMTDFLRVGFKQYAIKMTEFNAAMSYNLFNAVLGAYPNYTIDYPNALVSRGNLKGVANGTAASTTPAEIDITWDDNSGSGNALATDKSLILILNPDKKESIYTTSGPARPIGSETLTLPAEYTGDVVEVYLGFVSADGTKVSNSTHLGSVTVA